MRVSGIWSFRTPKAANEAIFADVSNMYVDIKPELSIAIPRGVITLRRCRGNDQMYRYDTE